MSTTRRLLFFDLFLLGIDSGFALLEGGLTAAGDTVYFCKVTKAKLSGFGCVIGFLFSLIYATDAGLIFLDTVDFYINFVMLFVGFLEIFCSWMGLRNRRTSPRAGYASCILLLCCQLHVRHCRQWTLVRSQRERNDGRIRSSCCHLSCWCRRDVFLPQEKDGREPRQVDVAKSIIWAVSFKNMFDLRDRLRKQVGWLPWVWAFFMKQFIPHLVLILFINLAAADNATGESLFGHYGDYVSWPFQILGILTVAFVLFLFVLGPCGTQLV